tara:strand:- start:305 stop:1063 length:759 start_codon:yes stop_codon:yes gene_type:complete
MRNIILILSLSWLLFGTSQATQLNQLQYLTEDYPPYNYKEGDTVTGLAVDLLIEASKVSGSELSVSNISLQPWPRAYRSTLIRPDTVLFSTTRTESREELFKWAGPISTTRIVILAKRSRDIEITHPMQIAKYRIGVIRDDVGEQLLLTLGVPRDSMIESSVPQTLAKQFAKDRIDVWAYEENVARWWLKKEQLESDELEVVYVLREGELYYAFNQAVDDELINQLQVGLDSVKQQRDSQKSVYETILEKYF